jgi:hypothetical protein
MRRFSCRKGAGPGRNPAQQHVGERKPRGIGDSALFGAMVAKAHLLHLPFNELREEDAGFFIAEVTFHA